MRPGVRMLRDVFEMKERVTANIGETTADLKYHIARHLIVDMGLFFHSEEWRRKQSIVLLERHLLDYKTEDVVATSCYQQRSVARC